jgi:hypothetical protein
MWAVFMLQDLTGLSRRLRRQSPRDERINDPADLHQKWRYVYPFTLKELVEDRAFTSHIKGMAEDCNRI